jgi:hypothetical protein
LHGAYQKFYSFMTQVFEANLTKPMFDNTPTYPFSRHVVSLCEKLQIFKSAERGLRSLSPL